MNVLELIKLLEPRPVMYISRHNLSSLRAFIDGWYFRNQIDDVGMDILNDFQIWLQERNQLDNYRRWDTIIIYLCQDDNKALDYFFKLFNEFLLEKEINSNHLF